MTAELTALALAGLLHVAQFAAASYMANVDLGPRYTTGPRDAPPKRALRVATARMLRAYDNHVQMLGLFAAGVLVVSLGQQTSPVTAAAAWTYLAARALYIPAYAFGWQPWRSYIWLVALAACTALFLAALI